MLASAPMHDSSYFEREYFQLHPGKVKYLDYLVGLLRAHGVPNGRVLDVGAGYGFFLEALERGGYATDGLEISAHAVEQARRRSRGQVIEQGAEAPFPFPDDHFDAITLLDVIEHLQDYAQTLASCRRCLKPGGSCSSSPSTPTASPARSSASAGPGTRTPPTSTCSPPACCARGWPGRGWRWRR